MRESTGTRRVEAVRYRRAPQVVTFARAPSDAVDHSRLPEARLANGMIREFDIVDDFFEAIDVSGLGEFSCRRPCLVAK